MLFVCRPKILHKHCLQFLLGVKMAPRETENNVYAKFGGDKQRALWYVMVFNWSGESLNQSAGEKSLSHRKNLLQLLILSR